MKNHLAFLLWLLILACSSLEVKEQANTNQTDEVKDVCGNPAGGLVSQTAGQLYRLPNRLIALTFDDGPGNRTLQLVQYLRQQHIAATFFVCGDVGTYGFEHYPGLLDQMIHTYGQRIGNHSYNHEDLRFLAQTQYPVCTGVQTQIDDVQSYIEPIIQNNLSYFRAPWASWSDSAAHCALQWASLNQLRGPMFWDFLTADFEHKTEDPAAVANLMLQSNADSLNLGKGGIVLMHDFDYPVGHEDFPIQETMVLVDYFKQHGYIFVSPTLEFAPSLAMSQGTDFSDSATPSWTDTDYSGSIRLADVTGDRKADLIARYNDGIYVAKSKSDGLGFYAATRWTTQFSNAAGFKPAAYSSTIQCADADGDGMADIIIRDSDGIRVARSNGAGFETSSRWLSGAFSDGGGWNSDIGFYGTIRAADINGDGKADIAGRGANGLYVYLSTGTSFEATPTHPDGLWTTLYSDAGGWKPAKYSSTIQFGDINGDGKADVIGRSATGILAALSTGTGFANAQTWATLFTDAGGGATTLLITTPSS